VLSGPVPPPVEAAAFEPWTAPAVEARLQAFHSRRAQAMASRPAGLVGSAR
jgi:hypothetical protein